jgi:energy-coupling factor transporter transmembrane protein EcfT
MKILWDISDRLESILDKISDLTDVYWYDPLDRIVHRMPTWLYIILLPLVLIALAIPPLVFSILVISLYGAVVVGILVLVGVL